MDADGQHCSETITAIVDALKSGADVVLGVRHTRPRFAEHLFAFGTNLRWQIRDPLCGMKGYRVTVYNQLGHFDSYNSIGTELALYAARGKLSIAQVPVNAREIAETRRDLATFYRLTSAFSAQCFAACCHSIERLSGRKDEHTRYWNCTVRDAVRSG